jgi:hypothetical protein
VLELSINWNEYAAVLVGLHAVSWGYNAMVAWFSRNGYSDGYTAIQVVVGVLYTLAGLALVMRVEDVLLVCGGFIASGIPMIIGDLARYVKMRRREEDLLHRAAKDLVNSE